MTKQKAKMHRPMLTNLTLMKTLRLAMETITKSGGHAYVSIKNFQDCSDRISNLILQCLIRKFPRLTMTKHESDFKKAADNLTLMKNSGWQ